MREKETERNERIIENHLKSHFVVWLVKSFFCARAVHYMLGRERERKKNARHALFVTGVNNANKSKGELGQQLTLFESRDFDLSPVGVHHHFMAHAYSESRLTFSSAKYFPASAFAYYIYIRVSFTVQRKVLRGLDGSFAFISFLFQKPMMMMMVAVVLILNKRLFSSNSRCSRNFAFDTFISE